MENFEPKQLVSNEINNGEKYRNNVDSPQADAFNKLVGAILYAQENGVKITIDTELSSTSENAVQNKVIYEALSGKLNIFGIKDQNLSVNQAYCRSTSGTPFMITIATNALGYSIPRRSSNGRFEVSTPVNDKDCTNKKYVDDNFAPKTYTHNITIKCSEGITNNANEFELRATLTSKRHDVYRSIKELEGIVVENAEIWDLRGYWNEETMQDEPELKETFENVTIETRIETADFDENCKNAYLILRDASGNVVLEVGSLDVFNEAPSFYIASDIVE